MDAIAAVLLVLAVAFLWLGGAISVIMRLEHRRSGPTLVRSAPSSADHGRVRGRVILNRRQHDLRDHARWLYPLRVVEEGEAIAVAGGTSGHVRDDPLPVRAERGQQMLQDFRLRRDFRTATTSNRGDHRGEAGDGVPAPFG